MTIMCDKLTDSGVDRILEDLIPEEIEGHTDYYYRVELEDQRQAFEIRRIDTYLEKKAWYRETFENGEWKIREILGGDEDDEPILILKTTRYYIKNQERYLEIVVREDEDDNCSRYYAVWQQEKHESKTDAFLEETARKQYSGTFIISK